MKPRFPSTLPVAAAALAGAFLSTTSARAEIEVTPDHIVAGSATGTLVAIDVPYTSDFPTNGGPAWTTGGSIVASPADQGFSTVNDGIEEDNGVSRWEPDGTSISEARAFFTYGASRRACPFAWPEGGRRACPFA